jgi:hypothetical protein
VTDIGFLLCIMSLLRPAGRRVIELGVQSIQRRLTTSLDLCHTRYPVLGVIAHTGAYAVLGEVL